MQYRRLGSSGLQLSALSFGAWVTFGGQIGRSEARNLIAAAYDNGVNFFDNAEVYAKGEAEKVMGDVIADLRLPRDGYCVSSKVFFGAVEDPKPTQRGLSRKHVFEACHAALQRLRVDHLDLYFCHRPDPDTPIEETVWAMDALIRQGKVLYWGTSEWSAAQIKEASRIARAHHLYAPTMEQPQYNLLHRTRVELEYAQLYSELGLGTTIWSPLASGLLTGKYNEGVAAESRLGMVAAHGGRGRGKQAHRPRTPVYRSGGRAGREAFATGHRLVSAQSACVHGVAGRQPYLAVAGEPGRAGAGGSLRRCGLGTVGGRHGRITEGLDAGMRIIII